MNIVIGDKKQYSGQTNSFKVVVEFMSGDADAYSTETYFIKKENEAELIDLLETLDSVEQNCESIPEEFNKFTSGELSFTLDWQIDSTCDDYFADLSISEITYFDENCIEYQCTVVS